MKFFILLIFLVEVFVECDSSCETKDENIRAVKQMLWKKRYYYENDNVEYRPLEALLRYFREKKEFETIVDVGFPKLQCDIETICTTTKSNTVKILEEENLYSFCELFFIFENKKEFIFTIDHFQLSLFSHQNFTIHSNQLFNKPGVNIFNTRYL